jgi:polyisoprenoid-binding protein YceI
MAVTETASLTRTVDGAPVPPAGRYEVDPSHSEVAFVARHLVVARTRGTFGSFRGTAVIAEDPTESTLEAEVDLASVDTRDAGRDEHLRSADFFHVDEHPTMRFESTAVRRDGDRWAVEGDLTIRGVTNPVTLDVEFLGGIADPWGNTRAAFSARAELDREQWGLNWNQALETGGVLVGKKVQIELEAELIKS